MTNPLLSLIFFAQEATPKNGAIVQFLFFGLLIAGMYFLLIAPQKKKQKAHQRMIQSLKTGDKIVTTGGIYGTITNVKDNRFVIKVAENTKLEIGKAFVQTREQADKPVPEEK